MEEPHLNTQETTLNINERGNTGREVHRAPGWDLRSPSLRDAPGNVHHPPATLLAGGSASAPWKQSEPGLEPIRTWASGPPPLRLSCVTRSNALGCCHPQGRTGGRPSADGKHRAEPWPRDDAQSTTAGAPSPPRPCFSKCRPWTDTTSILWKLVKSTFSGLLQTYRTGNSGGRASNLFSEALHVIPLRA